jgi:hypothetical protein
MAPEKAKIATEESIKKANANLSQNLYLSKL